MPAAGRQRAGGPPWLGQEAAERLPAASQAIVSVMRRKLPSLPESAGFHQPVKKQSSWCRARLDRDRTRLAGRSMGITLRDSAADARHPCRIQ